MYQKISNVMKNMSFDTFKTTKLILEEVYYEKLILGNFFGVLGEKGERREFF